MEFNRPVFIPSNLCLVFRPEQVAIAIEIALNVYRKFVVFDLMKRQKEWAQTVPLTADFYWRVVAGEFFTKPLLDCPAKGRGFREVQLDRALLYVYGPRDFIADYVKTRTLWRPRRQDIVACTMPPFRGEICKQEILRLHNRLSFVSYNTDADVEYYVAILPNQTFAEGPSFLLESSGEYCGFFHADGVRAKYDIIAFGRSHFRNSSPNDNTLFDPSIPLEAIQEVPSKTKGFKKFVSCFYGN
ncbi:MULTISPECIES: RolB family protein [Rhizobium/Agrobacterium group]|uniref:T-DNA oncoprotein n=1 Tax=Agrobacterium tumefaciens TaxID=358 RepID=O88163_AGRTU|nr:MULTISPECIES: RolB family protein [Rhizobium/Agrobacterium group]AAC25913.1 T-DNA oncoprotein [Agrobacterium tumefaciens]MBO9112481.1 RolB family protein [Agrobacterium sp. S2/73]QXZ76605.1 RolB family protein [Agrobacterium sp. S7/73]QYA17365.1 RolB family protein [Rhizobium sp. AB2/73]UEQ85643.1 RolB family protein [Rhizobium sp. AB2/73]